MLELAARADWLDAPHTFNEQERACLYGDVGGARALLKNSRYKQNRMQIEWNVGGDEIQLPANRTPAVCLLKGVLKAVFQEAEMPVGYLRHISVRLALPSLPTVTP